MELAAHLQENAILLLSRGGAFAPFFKPNPGVQFVWTAERHRRAFAAFSKQNDKYPTNARGGNRHTWNWLSHNLDIMSLRIYLQEKSSTFDKLGGYK